VKPPFLARLIDDVFFLWNDSEDKLIEFINHLNSCHDSIKFEVTYSQDTVHFLDTTIFIKDGALRTSIFTKPSDKKQYLHYSSNHPLHVMKAIPYSQALRFRRIIDDDTSLHAELLTLMKFFKHRGYPSKLLNDTLSKINSIDRALTLIYKDATAKRLAFDKYLKGKSFLPLIVQFSYSFTDQKLCDFLHVLWDELVKVNVVLSNVFLHEFPQLVYKRGTTIGNLLISSKFKPFLDAQDLENIDILTSLANEPNIPFVFRVTQCNSDRCKCCEHIVPTSTFHNSNKTVNHDILSDFNCASSNLLYVISCMKCCNLYVGQTRRTLRERLTNHRSNIHLKTHTSISIHFNLPTHSISDLIITPILDISSLTDPDRIKMEYKYMSLLGTFYPKGLNCYPLVKM
jgi:hypothetical protein